MTDFFADLEHELRAAHRRDAKRAALPRVRPRRAILAFATAAVAALAVVAVLTLAGGGTDEREAVAPPRATPTPDHGIVPVVPDGGRPQGHTGEAGEEEPLDSDPPQPQAGACGDSDVIARGRATPTALLDAFGALRGRGDDEGDLTWSYTASVTRAYWDGERHVERLGSSYSLLPVDLDPDGSCNRHEPGICFGRTSGSGVARLACATLEHVRERGILIREGESSGSVYGFVTDDIRRVVLEWPEKGGRTGQLEVQPDGNIFTAGIERPGGKVRIAALRR